jgi:hypothetical protein
VSDSVCERERACGRSSACDERVCKSLRERVLRVFGGVRECACMRVCLRACSERSARERLRVCCGNVCNERARARESSSVWNCVGGSVSGSV